MSWDGSLHAMVLGDFREVARRRGCPGVAADTPAEVQADAIAVDVRLEPAPRTRGPRRIVLARAHRQEAT